MLTFVFTYDQIKCAHCYLNYVTLYANRNFLLGKKPSNARMRKTRHTCICPRNEFNWYVIMKITSYWFPFKSFSRHYLGFENVINQRPLASPFASFRDRCYRSTPRTDKNILLFNVRDRRIVLFFPTFYSRRNIANRKLVSLHLKCYEIRKYCITAHIFQQNK